MGRIVATAQPGVVRGILRLFSLAALCLAAAGLARAAEPDLNTLAGELFAAPAVEIDVGVATGTPPAHAVFRNGRPIGYLASTWQVTRSVGYSGKPIDILVAVTDEGRIAGARLIAQSEPVLVIGIAPEDLAGYVEAFAGFDLKVSTSIPLADRPGIPDAFSGATVSSTVMRDAIVRTARAVAGTRGILGAAPARTLDRASFSPVSWQELVEEGAVSRRKVSIGEANRALGVQPSASDENLFIALDAALLTPPRIGQNLIGQRAFSELAARLGPDDNAIIIAGNGLYSFKGTDYRRRGVFERIELVQGTRTIRFSAESYRNVQTLAAEGAPPFREIGLFVLPAASGFDPTAPWRLNLLASREIGGGAMAMAQFALPYRLPDRYVLVSDGEETFAPVERDVQYWLRTWTNRILGIVVISLMLGLLTAILVFQDWIAERYRLYRVVRLSFLAATLVLIGWWLGAQLSVVHVIAFVQALLTGFSWELFLLDPYIFILWSFVAVALLFWGRGVFCGWLCPFGALQELLSEAARKLGIKQIQVSFAVHERLWPIKYIVFLALFAVSLTSVTAAFVGAEIEPFKTVITLKFMREWPFVAFALALLAAGLFIERFYCRYLCPLGAALAIPARLRMFDWLKRRPQCGSECNVCARRCTVQAIHPDGHINPNECIHCLNCQMLYYDERTCPPLIERAKRRRRREAVAARHRAGQTAGIAK